MRGLHLALHYSFQKTPLFSEILLCDGAASRTLAAELDRIVAGLDEGKHKLPVEPIREAREHRDLMVPRLIKVFRDTTSAALADDTPEGNAHFFALFLLSEFHAEESLPAILEVISLPGECGEADCRQNHRDR